MMILDSGYYFGPPCIAFARKSLRDSWPT